MATKKFRCKVCGYVHEGDKAPEKCPVCSAPASEFEELAPEKKGLNTNSNVYTILYAAVMVVIVAFLLVFVSQTLKERQTANVINDTKQQILSALNLRDQADVAATYDKVITADALMQPNGKLMLYEGDFNTSYKSEFAVRLHKGIGCDNLVICSGNIGLIPQVEGRQDLLLGIIDYVGCLTLLESL